MKASSGTQLLTSASLATIQYLFKRYLLWYPVGLDHELIKVLHWDSHPDSTGKQELMDKAVINEIQEDYYTQEIDLTTIQVLLDIGVLAHSQTTVTDYTIHRYFVRNDAEREVDYRVSDLRNERDTELSEDAYRVYPRSHQHKDYAQLKDS